MLVCEAHNYVRLVVTSTSAKLTFLLQTAPAGPDGQPRWTAECQTLAKSPPEAAQIRKGCRPAAHRELRAGLGNLRRQATPRSLAGHSPEPRRGTSDPEPEVYGEAPASVRRVSGEPPMTCSGLHDRVG